MQAIVVRSPGRAEARRDVEVPPLEAGRARVEVRFAGIGFADAMAARGGYPLAPRPPFSPGYEFMGRIAEAGGHESRLAPGTRVVGLVPSMGAYRGLVDVDPRLVAVVPDSLGDEAAAAIPLNYLTALALIERSAGLTRGRSFLVHGAAGGVGSASLDLARQMGLKAYGSSSAAKRGTVEAYGGVPLRREDGAWLAELRALEPRGVDAAFDAFGPASLRRSWRALSSRGRLVCYGFASAAEGGYPEIISGLAYLGSRALLRPGRGVRLLSLPRVAARDPAWCGAALSRVLAGAASGALSPLVAAIYPWTRAGEALESLASGSVKGKLLLEFR